MVMLFARGSEQLLLPKHIQYAENNVPEKKVELLNKVKQADLTFDHACYSLVTNNVYRTLLLSHIQNSLFPIDALRIISEARVIIRHGAFARPRAFTVDIHWLAPVTEMYVIEVRRGPRVGMHLHSIPVGDEKALRATDVWAMIPPGAVEGGPGKASTLVLVAAAALVVIVEAVANREIHRRFVGTRLGSIPVDTLGPLGVARSVRINETLTCYLTIAPLVSRLLFVAHADVTERLRVWVGYLVRSGGYKETLRPGRVWTMISLHVIFGGPPEVVTLMVGAAALAVSIAVAHG